MIQIKENESLNSILFKIVCKILCSITLIITSILIWKILVKIHFKHEFSKLLLYITHFTTKIQIDKLNYVSLLITIRGMLTWWYLWRMTQLISIIFSLEFKFGCSCVNWNYLWRTTRPFGRTVHTSCKFCIEIIFRHAFIWPLKYGQQYVYWCL